MKKVLFIYKSKNIQSYNHEINSGWPKDCRDMYNVRMWGEGFGDTDISSLQSEIDTFKPDYIYMTMRKRYGWLPDISSIKVPKIFVEVDTWKYPSDDPWYSQFDMMYCREQEWIVRDDSMQYLKKTGFNSRFGLDDPRTILKNCLTWKNIPLLRWSVPEIAFPTAKELKHNKRKGIRFIGHYQKNTYAIRKKLSVKFKNHISFSQVVGLPYWDLLKKSSALICPTESNFGDFVPCKLFEFAASGAAVITNCDVGRHRMGELDRFFIRYDNFQDLGMKLDIDFRPYHNKAIEAMRNHTHRIRYKELFG